MPQLTGSVATEDHATKPKPELDMKTEEGASEPAILNGIDVPLQDKEVGNYVAVAFVTFVAACRRKKRSVNEMFRRNVAKRIAMKKKVMPLLLHKTTFISNSILHCLLLSVDLGEKKKRKKRSSVEQSA